MTTVSSLIIPFIGIIILSLMVDKFTLVLEQVMKKVPFLPDQFEKPIAYAVVSLVSYVACWRGHFSLFEYLGFLFEHPWEGWVFTAMVLSGGSAFLREGFGLMDAIPYALGNTMSSIRKITTGTTGTTTATSTTTKATTVSNSSEIASEPVDDTPVQKTNI